MKIKLSIPQDCNKSPNKKHARRYIGICLCDWDTGFEQELSECIYCGVQGQSPAMYHKHAIQGKFIDNCIYIEGK